MKQPTNIVVFVTTSGPDESTSISQALLERRQAACVNSVSGVSSRFWWRDKLESAEEDLLIVKSKDSLLPNIIETVKQLSRNEVPEVIAMPVIGGNQDYLDWLNHETA
ncbi:MAG TPA: divalent-cation tolerance protein CutA [Spirochaetes bacterium]|nr:divalent-cation tolerance protein CutA [Spirochaetota bacterium]